MTFTEDLVSFGYDLVIFGRCDVAFFELLFGSGFGICSMRSVWHGVFFLARQTEIRLGEAVALGGV